MTFNEVEAVRLREAEHRYRNSLQVMGNLTRRQLRNAQGEEAREVLTYVHEMLEIFGALHRTDHQSDLASRLERICVSWQRLCGGHIEVTVEADETIVLTPEQSSTACLIVQELVLNAIKHAFPEGRHGTIHVRFLRWGINQAILSVSDDGIGMAAAARRRSSNSQDAHFGEGLIKSMAALLGGTAHRSSHGDEGLSVAVCWPLEERCQAI